MRSNKEPPWIRYRVGGHLGRVHERTARIFRRDGDGDAGIAVIACRADLADWRPAVRHNERKTRIVLTPRRARRPERSAEKQNLAIDLRVRDAAVRAGVGRCVVASRIRAGIRSRVAVLRPAERRVATGDGAGDKNESRDSSSSHPITVSRCHAEIAAEMRTIR